jgi:hypothetical protein
MILRALHLLLHTILFAERSLRNRVGIQDIDHSNSTNEDLSGVSLYDLVYHSLIYLFLYIFKGLISMNPAEHLKARYVVI